MSSYATFANNPVRYSDVLGLDTIFMLPDGKELRRIKNEKDEEPVGIVLLPELVLQSKRNDNPNNNPYREGSRPWETFNRNIDNPNLWNNRSTFSWAGSGQSQWIRDFNRAFGTTLLAGMTGPFAGELAGAALVGSVNAATAIPSVVRTGAFYTRYYGTKAIYNTGRVYSTLSSRAIQVGIEVYAGNVMGIPMVKIIPSGIFASGVVIGYYSQMENLLPHDISTGILFFDLGMDFGTLFR